MAINNLEELKTAAETAGNLLQDIQNYCQKNDLNWAECQNAKVKFPAGFIRTASIQRARMPFLDNMALKSNLAYTLILSDVILWLSLRTSLWGTPKEMLTKLYVFLIATLCESITKEYLKGVCGKNFKPRNQYLLDTKIIDSRLKDDLDWLWDTRNRMHLFQLEEREYENEYDQQCHQRCVQAFRDLLKSLSRHKQTLKQ
jgi:hypothetical protein